MDDEKGVNPYSDLIIWAVKWYMNNEGLTQDQAIHKSLTLGMAIQRKLIDPNSLMNVFLYRAQMKERDESTLKEKEFGGY